MGLYEDVVQYNIYDAIRIKGELKNDFSTVEELLHFYNNDPARIPNNPLLTDYDWVYEHAEELFCRNRLDYQHNQGYEEYYTLFKVLLNKYPLEKDYEEYMRHRDRGIEQKWRMFAINLIDFISYALNENLEELLDDPEVINYFLRYPEIYTPEMISKFSYIGIEKFLRYGYYSSYYIKNHNDLIKLIKNNPKINIPKEVMLDKTLIRDMCRTSHIEEFYYKLNFIREQVCELSYLEEHKKYCDEQVENIKNGILPCYQEKYEKSKKLVSLEEVNWMFNSMEKQVVERIFELNGNNILSKKYLYKELSKYMLIGMYMSRNFQTSPYNLLIDIETLHKFAQKNNRQLQGQVIYDFLMSFESKTTRQILDMYNYSKKIPLMQILYDDWNNQKNQFIRELNSKMIDPSTLYLLTSINGVECYDISDIEDPILVHNTSIPIDNFEKIEEMINKIKTGLKYRLCLSVQDQNHNTFYEKEEIGGKNTLKLAYGELIPDRVGIIYHKDAYSFGIDNVEPDNHSYRRKLYTLKDFMEVTNSYNEIDYVINKTPFLPIGVICEDNITKEELEVAKMLNVPILYRKKRKINRKIIKFEQSAKGYSYTAEKVLFKK